MTLPVAEVFAGAVPPDILLTNADDIKPYLTDWRGVKTGHCTLVLRPRTVADVVAIVQAAAKHRVGLVPQGGNTGLVGGSVPEVGPGRVAILSLGRMNRIVSVDAPGLSMEVEAGAILANVHAAAESAGVRFPLSLGSKGSATIGGLASTNAGGTQVLRFGPMRSLVLGVEAVLADGTILNQLSPLRKDNTGYDIKQLLIGAEGTLGIVTKLGLRLVPADRQTTVAWVGVDSLRHALALLHRLRIAAGEAVESFELIGEEAMQLIKTHIPDIHMPLAGKHGFHLLIEVAAGHGLVEDVLAAALADTEIEDATIATTIAQAEALWNLREHVPIAEKLEGTAVKNDIAVPVAAVPEFVDEAKAMLRRDYPSARPVIFGHLGDGNLHFNFCPPEGDGAKWLAETGEEARHALHNLIRRYHGTISAEHGIGTLKKSELMRLGDPGKLAAMQAVKRALDPFSIMNPGKLVG